MKKPLTLFLLASCLFGARQSYHSISHKLYPNRAPSSVETEIKIDELKVSLKKLEIDLIAKEELVNEKIKSLAKDKSKESEEKIKKLESLISNHKEKIKSLKNKIDQMKGEDQEITATLCHTQKESLEIEDEIKKLLKDQMEVVSKVSEKKEENKTEKKNEEVINSVNNHDLLILLNQITSLMISNSYQQMPMQMTMPNFMYSPYSPYFNPFQMPYFNQQPQFQTSFNRPLSFDDIFSNQGIGISAHAQSRMPSSFSLIPESAQAERSFEGFDFHHKSQSQSPLMELSRQSI